MPRYIECTLKWFQHPHTKCPDHAPHIWQKPTYGTAVQFTPDLDHTPALNATGCQHVQEVIGILLYYAWAVDPTLLTALGTLATQQAQSTQATMEGLTQLSSYCTTHPDACIWYHATDMILWAHSDVSYLSAPKGTSQAAGYYFLSAQPPITPTANDPMPPDNVPLHVLCRIMWQVVSSMAEAELGALFLNAQSACPIRTALDELGHPQPATPSKQITVWHVASSMTQSNRNVPRPLICAFIGFVTAPGKANFTFSGTLAPPIMLTTFQNTILPNTIRPCSTHTSNQWVPITITMWHCSGTNQNILVRVC